MNFVDWEITFNNTHFLSFFAKQKKNYTQVQIRN